MITRSAPAPTSTIDPGIVWWFVIVQLAATQFAFFAMSIPPVLALGMTNLGFLLSVVTSMAGGLLAAFAFLMRDGTVARAWDLAWPANRRRTWGLAAAGTGAIAFAFTAGGAIAEALGLPAIDAAMILDYVTAGPGWFVAWVILVAWLAAGFGEELLCRGFILDRLMHLRLVRGRRGAFWFANIGQAVLFALPHAYQGSSGVWVTGAIALFLGWLRRRAGWSLWPGILAHAAIDTIMMSLGYADTLGWIDVE